MPHDVYRQNALVISPIIAQYPDFQSCQTSQIFVTCFAPPWLTIQYMLGYFQPNYYGGIRKCMIIELICPTTSANSVSVCADY